MKLKKFQKMHGYFFYLLFENGKSGEVDLKELIADHVAFDKLDSAYLNKEWGCLEFDKHMVDIEPKTLYKFFLEHKITDNQLAS